MLHSGPGKKLIIFVSEAEQYHGVPTYEALLRWLHDHGVAGATVTRAIAGYGVHGTYHKPSTLRLTENLPIRIEVIESAEKINRILPFVYDIVGEGLIELLDTEVIKYTHKDEHAEQPAPEHIKLQGRAKMLRVYVGEDDRWEGEPLYEAIVKKLRMMDIAGATVYRGIMGYGAQQRVHKGGFLSLSHDRPVMVSLVDTSEKIRRAILALDEMVDEGLIVLSDVDVIKYTHTARSIGPGDSTQSES
jgi:PII-like signaling protein